MIVNPALSIELNTETKLINKITNASENYVSFSDKGKLLLSIITLGISYIIICLIKDHKKEKYRTECIQITKLLLSSLNNLEKEQSEEKFILTPLPKGEKLKLTQKFSNNENRYQTIIKDKKVRVFHLGQYNKSKSYVNKTFEEIKNLLVSNILKHEKGHVIVILKINKPNELIIYNKKTIDAKLRETHKYRYTSLYFIEEKNSFTNRHLILGIISPSEKIFLLSPSSDDDRNIYCNTNIKYVKLNLTSKEAKIHDHEEKIKLIKIFMDT
ncbi:MAG: hypothetical protein ACL7BU_08825 [Candidatus Phlomobacter fragariae]